MLNVFILTATHTYDKMLYNEVNNCVLVKHIKGGILNKLLLDILVKVVKENMYYPFYRTKFNCYTNTTCKMYYLMS